jgi:hypothetical protein
MELNRRNQFQEPEGTISEAGIAAVGKLIREQRLDQPEWSALNPEPKVSYVPALPDSWQWAWMVSTGDYRGTFPKRVAQFWFKGYSLKSPKHVIENIGNLARQHSSDPIRYEFDIVDSFDWEAGHFGDGNSCYWGGHSYARVMLRDNDGLAIRFYNLGTDEGIGRAWLVPYERFHILFNGYGLSGNSTLKIARIFAGWRGETYQRIELENNGHSGGTLYINGGTGYIIGMADDIAGVYSHDFHWGDPNTTKCTDCGEEVHEDDVRIGADDQPYCDDCYSESFTDCDICSNTRWREDCTYIDDQDVCERCMSRHYTVCDSCGRDIHNRDAHERNERDYCQECYSGLPVEK